MMNNLNPYAFEILLLCNALMLAAAALAITRFRRQCERLEQFWNSPTGAAIADDKSDKERLTMLTTMRLERTVTDLSRKVSLLGKQSSRRREPETRQLPIENAVRMAKGGASIDDLTRNCGLNIGEARLLTKMHGGTA